MARHAESLRAARMRWVWRVITGGELYLGAEPLAPLAEAPEMRKIYPSPAQAPVRLATGGG